MPCDCSYMEPTTREIELSTIKTGLDELTGKPYNYRRGYHPEVYNKGVKDDMADEWISSLCETCQYLGDDIKNCSLELQMWWRDHQRIDRER